MAEIARGSIADRPWGRTLAALGLRGVTGQLTLVADGKRLQIAFENGAVVAAASPLASDAAVRVALTGHLVSSSQVPEISRRQAMSPDRDEIDVIADLARLGPDHALRLRRRVIAQRAARTFSPGHGEFVVTDRVELAVLDGCELDVRAVIYMGARSNLSEQRLSAELDQLGSWFRLKPALDDDLPQFGFTDVEQPVVERLRDGGTIEELEDFATSFVDARTVRAVVYALAAYNACDCGPPRAPRPTPAPEAAASASVLTREAYRMDISSTQPIAPVQAARTSTQPLRGMPPAASAQPVESRTGTLALPRSPTPSTEPTPTSIPRMTAASQPTPSSLARVPLSEMTPTSIARVTPTSIARPTMPRPGSETPAAPPRPPPTSAPPLSRPAPELTPMMVPRARPTTATSPPVRTQAPSAPGIIPRATGATPSTRPLPTVAEPPAMRPPRAPTAPGPRTADLGTGERNAPGGSGPPGPPALSALSFDAPTQRDGTSAAYGSDPAMRPPHDVPSPRDASSPALRPPPPPGRAGPDTADPARGRSRTPTAVPGHRPARDTGLQRGSDPALRRSPDGSRDGSSAGLRSSADGRAGASPTRDLRTGSDPALRHPPEDDAAVAPEAVILRVPSSRAAPRTRHLASADSPQSHDVKAVIAQRLKLLDQGADHFQLLGVDRDVTPDALRRAYFALARQLHPDRLAALGISDDGKHAQRLFAQINAGFAILSDAGRRVQYVSVLRRGGEAVIRADEARAEQLARRVLEAEEAFRRGELALRRDQPQAAITELEAAIALNPDEADYHAVLAWAQFCAAPDKAAVAQTTRAQLDKAIQRSPRAVPARFYLGRVERMLGCDAEAVRYFREVLAAAPGHAEAAAELRVIEARLAGGDKPGGGLFGRTKR